MEHETSLDKALTVMEAVAAKGQVGLRTLAGQVGYPPPTVHRILSVLVRRGYISQDPASKEYRLSFRLFELSSALREDLDVVVLARPVLRELMEQSGETSNLVVFDNLEAVYVDQATNTSSMLRMFTRVGARAPLYCSGVGKAFLATLPDVDALAYFRKVEKKAYTENTILEETSFRRELTEIRRKGYALDNQEMENGVGCVAAAICNNGAVFGAISVSGPSTRMNRETFGRLGPVVAEAAQRVARKMGLGEVGSALRMA